ncbi:MAG: hypothetical protein FWC47_15715, partial [Oscillospiraceae bacterium]|nr:hypothetical protein [Oscillospiraceae bacterium]
DGFPNDNTTIELLGEFANWILGTPEQPYKLNPVYGQWGNYLTVSYIPQMYGGVASPDIQMPMLYTICFDMTSGDVVNFADVLPRKLSELPFEKAFIKMTPILHFEGTIIDNSYPAQGHSVVDVPKDGSVISEAWLYGDTLCLYITEPDGRKLQIAFIDVVNNILN